MESLKKKRNKIPGNKKLHKSNEKYSWKPLQQTGTSERQNLRVPIVIKKTRRILRQKTQEPTTTQ
jgi:hypothetical protein